MGTHTSIPSKDVNTGRTLLNLVSHNHALMTPELCEKYHHKLPFLLKVLSISKALSIQAHPNKKLAEELHAKDPEHYPDDNHKPEMTIAITPFEGLCGFRPLEEIAHFLGSVPPLRSLVGETHAKKLQDVAAASGVGLQERKSCLRAAFTSLAKSTPKDVHENTSKLVDMAAHGQITQGPSVNSGRELCELVTRSHAQFPNDIGLFIIFFLNLVKLAPGEAMYLKADDIHAYLSGDIIECMASSDNVIRAGFTPKFKDVNTLTKILTYDHNPPRKQLLEPVAYSRASLNDKARNSGSRCMLYDPPIEEFSVILTALNTQGASATFEAIDGPSIVICTDGQGTIAVGPRTEEMSQGFVYFVGAKAKCTIERTGGKQGNRMVTFRAFCELEKPKKGP